MDFSALRSSVVNIDMSLSPKMVMGGIENWLMSGENLSTAIYLLFADILARYKMGQKKQKRKKREKEKRWMNPFLKTAFSL